MKDKFTNGAHQISPRGFIIVIFKLRLNYTQEDNQSHNPGVFVCLSTQLQWSNLEKKIAFTKHLSEISNQKRNTSIIGIAEHAFYLFDLVHALVDEAITITGVSVTRRGSHSS